jgi:ankyrin repeat protein
MTLDETYERMLLEMDSNEREYVIRLFQCLAVSCRPLRTNELAEVLATQFDTGQIPRLNIDWRPEDHDETVLLACSNLVTTIDLGDHHDDNDHGDTRFVHFSHYSVKEFLTSERLAGSMEKNLSQFYISPESAHTTLAQSCIGTLLQLDNHTEDIVRSFPLAKYAAQYLFHHVQCDGVESRIENGIERLFDPDRPHFAVWVSMHDVGHVSSDSPLGEPINPPKPSPLYYATLFGFLRPVEYLVITRRQDPNKSPGGLGSPLHAAAFLGHTAIARFLLEHTADVNARNKYHPTPLHRAVERGNLDVAQLLLGFGADVNVLDHSGVSPLHKASRYQNLDLAELLVKGGADVNVRDKSKSTPLHEASRNGDLNVMQFLLSHGADINVLNRQGVAPLHEASRSQKLDAVELLVKGGAAVNVRDKRMSTPLHKASGRGDLDVVQVLLGLGARVNVHGQQGVTPLQEATRYEKLDVVKLLLEKGADVNARNKSKSTALHEAAGVGNLDITKLLLSHGAEVNAFDRWGDSPIHTASRFQKIDVVELLVKNGANVNVRERRSNNRVPGDNMNGTSCVKLSVRSISVTLILLCVDGSRYTWMVTAVATVAVVVTAVVNRYR